jgi:hypothetical protein
VFDYLSGNTDRHKKNWVVDDSAHLWMIDHGMSFPRKVPDMWNAKFMDKARYENIPIPVSIKDNLVRHPWSDVETALKPYLDKKALAYAHARWERVKQAANFADLPPLQNPASAELPEGHQPTIKQVTRPEAEPAIVAPDGKAPKEFPKEPLPKAPHLRRKAYKPPKPIPAVDAPSRFPERALTEPFGVNPPKQKQSYRTQPKSDPTHPMATPLEQGAMPWWPWRGKRQWVKDNPKPPKMKVP